MPICITHDKESLQKQPLLMQLAMCITFLSFSLRLEKCLSFILVHHTIKKTQRRGIHAASFCDSCFVSCKQSGCHALLSERFCTVLRLMQYVKLWWNCQHSPDSILSAIDRQSSVSVNHLIACLRSCMTISQGSDRSVRGTSSCAWRWLPSQAHKVINTPEHLTQPHLYSVVQFIGEWDMAAMVQAMRYAAKSYATASLENALYLM